MIKWIDNLELAHKKRRLDRIEKKYYKAFPDRVNDHFIATRPIETLIVKKYELRPITLEAMENVPREMINFINETQEEEFFNYLKHSLFSKFEPALIKYMKINRDRNITPYSYTYRARIKFYIDDREED